MPGIVWAICWSIWFRDYPRERIVHEPTTAGPELTLGAGPSWAFCLDIGGKSSGTVSAAMNMAGNFGGFVSTNAFPLLRRLTGSPATYFQTAAVLNLAAILCWGSMRSLSTPNSQLPTPRV